ncbi:uncharacterized protein LOC106753195 isoform X4 [Vigna radiata var. radiata]|uniref:Uncharacterized protein LOC106753195 isoform X4 n=1 Tax=Vigna radiata var. radiata TaxID=3916 RepID=A0A3Q0EMM4_VIGRR|nr:uncharacterized protein LOC106753195 isoform X4 [Vigna radiata var. radiata]
MFPFAGFFSMPALPYSLNDDPVSHNNNNLASHLCFRCGWFAFKVGNGIISLLGIVTKFTSILVDSFHAFFAGDYLFNRCEHYAVNVQHISTYT